MRLTFAVVIVPTLLRGVLPAAVTAVGGSWGAPQRRPAKARDVAARRVMLGSLIGGSILHASANGGPSENARFESLHT